METTLRQPFELRMPRINLRNINTSMRAVVACMCLTAFAVVTAGCTVADTKQVIQNVANAIPTIKADVDVAANIIISLDPAAALPVAGVIAIVDPALIQLQLLCNTYAQTSDPTLLGSINQLFNTLLNQSATSILDAAKIVNPQSRATALRVLTAIQIALQLAYTIYAHIQSKAQVKLTASMRSYKLKEIEPYMTTHDRERIEVATGYNATTALAYATHQGF